MADNNYGGSLTFGGVSIGKSFVLSFPKIETEKKDATHHGSGGWRTSIPSGLITNGDITLSVMVEAGLVAGIKAAIKAKTIDDVVIVSNLNTYTYTEGFYLSIEEEGADAQNPDVMKCTIVMALNGEPTITTTVGAGDWWDSAIALAIVNPQIALTHPATRQLVVNAIMPNGVVITVDAADLTFTSSVEAKATVDAAGLITTVAAGDTTIKATTTDGGLLDAYALVTVS